MRERKLTDSHFGCPTIACGQSRAPARRFTWYNATTKCAVVSVGDSDVRQSGTCLWEAGRAVTEKCVTPEMAWTMP